MIKIYNDAIDAINNGGDVPKKIGDFRITYIHTDGWRGYYTAIPTKKSRWVKASEGWITGDYPDAGDNAYTKKQNEFRHIEKKAIAEKKEVVIFYMPTSNVFSTSYDIFTRDKKAIL